MAACRARRAGAAGFSFVDLMLVVAILGIVTAVGVQVFDTDERRLDGAARALVADLLEAQGLAIETRVPFGVAFDLARNRAEFVVADGTLVATAETSLRLIAGLDAGAVDRLVAAQTSAHTGFGVVTLTAANFGGQNRVVFGTDGTPQNGGAVDLRLGAFQLRVRVQSATGRVVVTAP